MSDPNKELVTDIENEEEFDMDFLDDDFSDLDIDFDFDEFDSYDDDFEDDE